MISGELDFDDRIHNENTKAHYKVVFFIYLLFLLIMTVFVTNLLIGMIFCLFRRLVTCFFLIGLAVGEIPPLMKQATDDRNRLFYDLVAIAEVFRYRLIWIFRRTNVNDTVAYSSQKLQNKKLLERFTRWVRSSHRHDDNDDADSDMSNECVNLVSHN